MLPIVIWKTKAGFWLVDHAYSFIWTTVVVHDDVKY